MKKANFTLEDITHDMFIQNISFYKIDRKEFCDFFEKKNYIFNNFHFFLNSLHDLFNSRLSQLLKCIGNFQFFFMKKEMKSKINQIFFFFLLLFIVICVVLSSENIHFELSVEIFEF